MRPGMVVQGSIVPPNHMMGKVAWEPITTKVELGPTGGCSQLCSSQRDMPNVVFTRNQIGDFSLIPDLNRESASRVSAS